MRRCNVKSCTPWNVQIVSTIPRFYLDVVQMLTAGVQVSNRESSFQFQERPFPNQAAKESTGLTLPSPAKELFYLAVQLTSSDQINIRQQSQKMKMQVLGQSSAQMCVAPSPLLYPLRLRL